jgi:hypothetical protein
MPLSTIIHDFFRHIRAGLVVTAITFFLLLVWHTTRDNYRVTSRITIGGFMSLSKQSVPQFELIEQTPEAERFAIYLLTQHADLASKCTVRGVSVPEKAVEITCEGATPAEARSRLMRLASPIMVKHRNLFGIGTTFYKNYMEDVNARVKLYERRINALRSRISGSSGLLAALLQDRLSDIEDRRMRLLNEIRVNDIQNAYNKMSVLADPIIEHKLSNYRLWFIIFTVPFLSGILAMALLCFGNAMGKQGKFDRD